MEEQRIGMKNLKSRKLYIQVYDELRNYIAQHQLSPGDMLPTEMEMCSMMGVSRNVLREAIKALEITGIVSSKPGVGIIIQKFNPDFLFQTLFYNLATDSKSFIKQTLAVRRTLELGFLKEAFGTLQPDDIVQLRCLSEEMDHILQDKSKSNTKYIVFGQDFYRADAMFHNLLFSRINNIILKSIIDAVWQCDCFHKTKIHTTYIESTVLKHVRIVNALERHDFDGFSRSMHDHFDIAYKPEN